MNRGIRAGVRRLLRLQPRTHRNIHDEVDEELASYLEARVDYLMARGMSRDDANAEALRRLGVSVDEAKRRLHHSAERREASMRLHERIEELVGDLRYAVRGLLRRPAFTIVAILTLAVGIGGTTAIFSAVYALLLRRLPYAQPNELMRVSLVTPGRNGHPGNDEMSWSYPKYQLFRDGQRSFADLALYTVSLVTITSGEVEQVRGEDVSAHYLRVLGIRPMRGRDFDASADANPAPRQAIITEAFWRRRFDEDPQIIGRTFDINRQPYEIIGITPPGFDGLSGQATFFVPITAQANPDLTNAGSHSWYMLARRKASVSVAQAVSEAAALGASVNESFPDSFGGNKGWSAKASALDDARVAPSIRRSLYVLFGAVGFVLLIACVNVANLLIGRAATRRREIAVRLAIGAGRARLVRLLLTESLLLSLFGGAVGMLVAYWGITALNGVNPATTLRVQRDVGFTAIGFSSIHLDGATLAFALGAAVLVTVIFGLVPAMHATRASVAEALKGGASKEHRSGLPRWMAGRRLLVVSEVALALVLLAGSGLLIRSLSKLLAEDSGFEGRGVLTVRVAVPPGTMPRDSLAGLFTQMLARLQAVPGVSVVGAGNCAPLSGGCNGTMLQLLDRPEAPDGRGPEIGVHWATPRWFEAIRVPLKSGRMFSDDDRFGGPKVVVINEAAARAYWPNENPIGKRVGVGQGGFHKGNGGAEIVGIVGNIRQSMDSAAKPDVYLPAQQSPRASLMLFVRSASGDAASLGPSVRAAIREVAPSLPIYDMRPLDARTAAATAAPRFNATLLAIFAAVALALAVIGIYGVMSLAVSQRTREIGIRMALGADQRRVRGMVVREGLALVTVGGVIGLIGAVACTGLLRAQLYNVTPTDPMTYVIIVAVLAGAATLASWIPARRATRVHPTEALREG